MKKLYEKNELTFAIVWIVVYCVVQSIAMNLNDVIGVHYLANAVSCVILTAVLYGFIRKNGLREKYGLCKSPIPAKSFLYYLPLIILATANLWFGVKMNYTVAGTVCHVVSMLCVGFLEEVIFRGLLFKAMAKNNIKSAIIVSSITFGIGHIINLANGMNLLENICQIVFAVAVGFLFVTIFNRGGSLIPCIVTHSAINSLNTFANGTGITTTKQLIHIAVMIVITVGYTAILLKTLPKKEDGEKAQ